MGKKVLLNETVLQLKCQTVLEHKLVTKLFTLYCSAIILISQASCCWRKASFHRWWSCTGGMNIPLLRGWRRRGFMASETAGSYGLLL